MFIFPIPYLSMPWFSVSIPICLLLFKDPEFLIQLNKDISDISNNRYIHMDILPDVRRVYIYMDKFGPGSEFRHLAGNPVIEPCTNSYNQVRLMNCHIGRICPMHAEHAKKYRMSPRKYTQPT